MDILIIIEAPLNENKKSRFHTADGTLDIHENIIHELLDVKEFGEINKIIIANGAAPGVVNTDGRSKTPNNSGRKITMLTSPEPGFTSDYILELASANANVNEAYDSYARK